jgi:hypothetical protein
MNNDTARGWIFRNISTGNVAGISNAGQMTLASHLEQGNNLGRPNVNWSAGGGSTGMVIFYLPGTTANYGMVHMVFDIYEYNSPRVATVIVGGHNWSTSWYNVGCNVVGFTDKQVRLGVKDGRFCVVFGTSGSSWEYGTIVLRKIHNGGFYDNIMNMTGNWSSTQTTTESFTYVSGDLRGLRTPSTMEVDGILYGYNSVRSNIFYDSDNTGYYVDPASTSILNTVRASIIQNLSTGNTALTLNSSVYNQIHDASGSIRIWVGNASDPGNYYNNTSHFFRNTGSVVQFTINDSLGEHVSSLRAPIFYDSNNTGFYLDPASTSNINALAGNGKNALETSDSYLRINQGSAFSSGCWFGSSNILASSGYIAAGSNGGTTTSRVWINSGTYNGANVIYLDGSNGVVVALGDMRAPVFYDANNTGYYADFNSTGDSIRAAGNIVAYYSDERLKKHLGKIENALEKVDQLEGFYYEANEVAQKLGYKAKREVGVSAQAVQRVLPEIVTDAPISANYLTIDYERLVPLLIEAIKELKGEVETLKSRLH